MRCGEEPRATVALRYADRSVLIGQLSPQHDPSLLDLCDAHARSLTPPIGWVLVDERSPASTEGSIAVRATQ